MKKTPGKSLKANQAAEPGLLTDLNVELEISRLMRYLNFNLGTDLSEKQVQKILANALGSLKPRAFYKHSQLSMKKAQGLRLDNVNFNNPLLKVNLAKADLVFPFVITLGQDLKPENEDQKSIFKVIQQQLLDAALTNLKKHLTDLYNLNYIWSLVCGEMQAWPISGLRAIFDLLGDVEKTVGVVLKPDDTLSPASSIAGVLFYVETEFEGCQICPKEPCMMRRAQYSAELASKKGLKVHKMCGQKVD